jgi:hypothetical protein
LEKACGSFHSAPRERSHRLIYDHGKFDPPALKTARVALRLAHDEIRRLHSRQELAEQYLQLEQGEMFADAMMLSNAERNDARDRAVPNEFVRIVELALVARGRMQKAGDSLTRAYALTANG